jgi:hypothetical protein
MKEISHLDGKKLKVESTDPHKSIIGFACIRILINLGSCNFELKIKINFLETPKIPKVHPQNPTKKKELKFP